MISSDSPREYTSAVSMKFPPRSTNRSSWAWETSSLLSLPKVIVPRHCVDTTVPVLPKMRYSIGPPLGSRSGRFKIR